MHDAEIEDKVRGCKIKNKIITHFPAFNALMQKVVAKKNSSSKVPSKKKMKSGTKHIFYICTYKQREGKWNEIV